MINTANINNLNDINFIYNNFCKPKHILRELFDDVKNSVSFIQNSITII
jgi:hypothetical protein